MKIAAAKDTELNSVVMEVEPLEASGSGPPLYVAPIRGTLDGSFKEPIKASLCELVKAPERFNGRLVQVRAEYVSRFHWTGLKDESCNASIPLGTYHPLDDLGPGDGEYAFTKIADDLTGLVPIFDTTS